MQRLAIFLVLGLFATHASATSLTVGGLVFAGGEKSFADDAFLVSGTIRFTCATAAAGPAASVGAALTGSDLQQCANNNTGNSGIVEVLFLDNSLQNGAGADLAIFELSGSLPAGTSDPRERFGVSIYNGIGFTPFVYFDPIATGTNSCGDPSLCLDTFVVQIDLSSFGISDGGVTTRVQLHIYDVGLGTKSADIGALGALNSGPAVPEPSSSVLLVAALATFAAVRRCRPTRMGPEVVKRQSSPHAAGGRPSSVVVSPRGPTSLRLRRSVAAPNTYRGSRRAHDGASAGSMCSAA